MIVKKGDVVKETTDITSCAGFLWFIGDKKDVAAKECPEQQYAFVETTDRGLVGSHSI